MLKRQGFDIVRMTLEHAGIVVLALHLLADFPFQTDKMAAKKFSERGPYVEHIFTHAGVYFGPLVIFYGVDGALVAGIVTVAHALIDRRRWAEPKDGFEDYPIWVDQTFHVASIALAIMVVSRAPTLF